MRRRLAVPLGVIGILLLVIILALLAPRPSYDLRQRASHSYPAMQWNYWGFRRYLWRDENTLLFSSSLHSGSFPGAPPGLRLNLSLLDLSAGTVTPLPKPIRFPLRFALYARLTPDGRSLQWYEQAPYRGFLSVTTPLDGGAPTFHPVKRLPMNRLGQTEDGRDICFDGVSMHRRYGQSFWQAFQDQVDLMPIPHGKRSIALMIEASRGGSRRDFWAAIPGRSSWASLAVSPDGRQIAWFVSEQTPRWKQWMVRATARLPRPLQVPRDALRYGLWITDIKGRRPRYLGFLQTTPGGHRFYSRIETVRWSPQGKQLAFIFEDKVWTIPVSLQATAR